MRTDFGMPGRSKPAILEGSDQCGNREQQQQPYGQQCNTIDRGDGQPVQGLRTNRQDYQQETSDLSSR